MIPACLMPCVLHGRSLAPLSLARSMSPTPLVPMRCCRWPSLPSRLHHSGASLRMSGRCLCTTSTHRFSSRQTLLGTPSRPSRSGSWAPGLISLPSRSRLGTRASLPLLTMCSRCRSVSQSLSLMVSISPRRRPHTYISPRMAASLILRASSAQATSSSSRSSFR